MDRNELITKMIANPAEYGFSWGYGTLHKNEAKLTEKAPFMIHEDVEKLRKTFGDAYLLESANGTSARVRDQLLRNDIWDDRPLAKDDVKMKTIVLNRAFGVKRPKGQTIVKVTKFVASDGTEHDTLEACTLVNKALLRAELMAELAGEKQAEAEAEQQAE